MLNNSLKSLHPDLVRVQAAGLIIYTNDHPDGPRMGLNETSRNELIQDAYFAQGREPLDKINRLRFLAGLPRIGAAEAAQEISNARYGQSAHNFPLGRAFDSAATDRRTGKYIGDRQPYEWFWNACYEAAIAMHIDVTWGGRWKDWPHIELTHWRTLKA